MQTFIDFVNDNLTFLDIPGTKIVAALAAIMIALAFRRVFSIVLIRYVQRLTRKTKTTLDDEAVEVLKGPLGWLIVLGGLWMGRTILAEHLSTQVDEILQRGISLGFVVVLALIAYRSAKLLAQLLGKLSKRTRTEIDDLILPYVTTFVQGVAVLVVVIKASEVLLGISAAALVGLLGGAGITLGLVFKDVLSDWFSTAIIYTDDLYREGDMVELEDGSFAIAEKIGLRSTVARTFAGPVVRIPNSQMVRANIRNWSQAKKWKAEYKLSLDGVSAKKLEKVIQGIRRILQSEEGVDQSWHMVYLTRVEGNSRVISLEYCPDATGFSASMGLKAGPYYDQFVLTVEKINLAILTLLEEEQIDPLAYTLFGSIGAYKRTPVESDQGGEETIGALLMAEQRRTHSG